MDQYSAQPPDSGVPPPSFPSETAPVSPLKKFLPLIVIIIIVLFLFSALLLVSAKSKGNKPAPTPAPRPTATPFPLAPSIPVVSPATATDSASVAPEKIGRLSFIKDGDIYNTDLASITLLVKNSTPAGDLLKWSPGGNFLAWRPKSETATPSALTIYSRRDKVAATISPFKAGPGELLDFAWSPDENQLAVLTRNSSYAVSLYRLSQISSPSAVLVTRSLPIGQLLWPKQDTLIFSGGDGISSLNPLTYSSQNLVGNARVQNIKLSPDKTKILYSTGDSLQSTLSIINIDGTGNQPLPSQVPTVDMGNTGLSPDTLKKGFLPYAVWFPEGDKLMVGYHYQTNLPLVGIYDLKKSAFQAEALFPLYNDDVMTDDLRLLGARIVTQNGVSSWQLSLFTMEDKARLSIIRTIPGASSPAFFY